MAPSDVQTTCAMGTNTPLILSQIVAFELYAGNSLDAYTSMILKKKKTIQTGCIKPKDSLHQSIKDQSRILWAVDGKPTLPLPPNILQLCFEKQLQFYFNWISKKY